MQQVLFHIPILKESFPPDGIPVHGFGVMLFITFLACVWFLGWRSRTTGTNLPKERVQDLVIAVFVGGLLGARITYMIQYRDELEGWQDFFAIWRGGIVLYGGIIAGMLAFLLFHRYFLRKAGVSLWKLADVAGPGLALGIALGRVGCFLNGCCYGHVAPPECPSVGFPLLTCPAKEKVITAYSLQTMTGFTTKAGPDGPQSIVTAIEPASAAERAGLKVGDRIVAYNGQVNQAILIVAGQPEAVEKAAGIAREAGVTFLPSEARDEIRLASDDSAELSRLRVNIEKVVLFRANTLATDLFSLRMGEYRRGSARGQEQLSLEVEREGTVIPLQTFTPRSVGLHPTQLYETVSMLLLMVFLLAY